MSKSAPLTIAHLTATQHARLRRRLDESSALEPSTGCRLWLGAKTEHGYGVIRIPGDQPLAHRVAFVLANGPIAGGVVICHRCDVPACINPDHLFAGTQADNMRDCQQKGRGAVGGRNGVHFRPPPKPGAIRGVTKLTVELVLEIRRLRRTGISFGKLAQRFAMDKSTIQAVVARRSWRHVPDDVAGLTEVAS